MAKKRKKRNPKRWIQGVKIKKGALHRQLGIPTTVDIPVSLLRKIKATPTGRTISNPTKKGKRRIAVTTLLKRRVVFALNVR